MLHHVVWLKLTDVSEVLTASIIRAVELVRYLTRHGAKLCSEYINFFLIITILSMLSIHHYLRYVRPVATSAVLIWTFTSDPTLGSTQSKDINFNLLLFSWESSLLILP
jgi:hypothetical protein